MFGVRKISNILSNLNATLAKVNQTIHGFTDAASGVMTGDCVVAYQCNDYICLTISSIGTCADLTNLIFGNRYKLSPVLVTLLFLVMTYYINF